MNIDRVKRLLKEKENIRLEFKEAVTALPGNLFETICAMLNRDGGDIILGVSNDGKIVGVDGLSLNNMVANVVNLSNNPQKLDPPFILYPQTYDIKGKHIIHIQVPASSQVHKSGNIIFDRSIDGDFKVTHAHQIAECYNRKRAHYTEGIVFPFLRFSDFKEELFPKVRNLIRSNYPEHPWLLLGNEQLLEKAGLWRRDLLSGIEGYTLAAAMLFGKDETIQQILPHYKIDALVRIIIKDRYDDRLYIQTNLIEAYDQLMDFVAKHLPDPFFLQGDQRRSLRSVIFREVVANLIVHREYTNAHPCTFIIYHDRVETQNANNPHGEGPINPEKFAPFAKNPVIAKFFLQLGRVDELGSGVLNVNRYTKDYSGKKLPEFIEGAVFKMVIPVPETNIEEATGNLTEVVDYKGIENFDLTFKIESVIEGIIGDVPELIKKSRLVAVVGFIIDNPGIKVVDLLGKIDISERPLKNNIKTLIDAGLIIYKGSKKTGGYFPTEKLLTLA